MAKKIAVVGGRKFKDFSLLVDTLDELDDETEEIISGGAKGADQMAAKYARKRGLILTEFLPDFKKYRHPYHHRNRLIAEACEKLVAFWDGQSTGTKYTIDYAKKIGKEVVVIRYG